MPEDLRGPCAVEMVSVIHVETRRGTGEANDPVRRVHTYWTPTGERLAEVDEWMPSLLNMRHASTEAERAVCEAADEWYASRVELRRTHSVLTERERNERYLAAKSALEAAATNWLRCKQVEG